MLRLAVSRSSEHPPPSDLGEISVQGEVRLEVVKGCLQAENVAVVVHTLSVVSFQLSSSHSFSRLFLPPAFTICPHIFIGFLTPVDKRHPHLSAAATQPLVAVSLRRAENSLNESLPVCGELLVFLFRSHALILQIRAVNSLNLLLLI